MRHTVTAAIAATMLAAFFLSGCATPSPSAEQRPDIDRARVFFAEYDEVWTQLLAAVTTGEEELSLVDKTTGFISFQRNIELDQVERYAFDDSGMLLSSADANMVIKARPYGPGRTRVEINTKFTAVGKTWLDVILSRDRPIVLDSKGWLEREYFERLEAVLKARPVQPTERFDFRVQE
jgi:hypothetical protein